MTYAQHIPNRQQTSQNLPIPGSHQVRNSAGGYGFPVDDWTRLDRFLILGSEGGSFYSSEHRLTAENAAGALRCIQANGQRALKRVVEISESGRAPKNEPGILVLAMIFAYADLDTRR